MALGSLAGSVSCRVPCWPLCQHLHVCVCNDVCTRRRMARECVWAPRAYKGTPKLPTKKTALASLVMHGLISHVTCHLCGVLCDLFAVCDRKTDSPPRLKPVSSACMLACVRARARAWVGGCMSGCVCGDAFTPGHFPRLDVPKHQWQTASSCWVDSSPTRNSADLTTNPCTQPEHHSAKPNAP